MFNKFKYFIYHFKLQYKFTVSCSFSLYFVSIWRQMFILTHLFVYSIGNCQIIFFFYISFSIFSKNCTLIQIRFEIILLFCILDNLITVHYDTKYVPNLCKLRNFGFVYVTYKISWARWVMANWLRIQIHGAEISKIKID